MQIDTPVPKEAFRAACRALLALSEEWERLGYPSTTASTLARITIERLRTGYWDEEDRPLATRMPT